MATWASIKAEIITILKAEVSQVADANILDFEKSLPPGYPAITVVPEEGSGEFLDTARTQRNYDFKLRIFADRLNADDGGAAAEATVTEVVDRVTEIFDAIDNMELNGQVKYLPPSDVKWGYITAPDVDTRIGQIILTAVAVNDVT